jgi:predicted Zn-dependent protease
VRTYHVIAQLLGVGFLAASAGMAQTPTAQELLDQMRSGTSPSGRTALPSATVLPRPKLSSSSGDDIASEINLGRGIAEQILGSVQVLRDPAVQLYVSQVGQIVAQSGERRSLPWIFGVIDTPSLNAFALPGGVILISRGLFEQLDTEDELAAVLAHEIAHVQRKHHYKVVKRQQAIADVSALVRQDQSPAAGLLDTAMKRSTLIVARGLDKGAEYEADRDGMVLAARAGYDSTALLSVLEKLGRASDDGDSSLLFSTHPAPSDRIAQLAIYEDPGLVDASRLSPMAARIRSFQPRGQR